MTASTCLSLAWKGKRFKRLLDELHDHHLHSNDLVIINFNATRPCELCFLVKWKEDIIATQEHSFFAEKLV